MCIAAETPTSDLFTLWLFIVTTTWRSRNTTCCCLHWRRQRLDARTTRCNYKSCQRSLCQCNIYSIALLLRSNISSTLNLASSVSSSPSLLPSSSDSLSRPSGSSALPLCLPSYVACRSSGAPPGRRLRSKSCAWASVMIVPTRAIPRCIGDGTAEILPGRRRSDPDPGRLESGVA